MPVSHASFDIAATFNIEVNGCPFLTQHSIAAYCCERDQTLGNKMNQPVRMKGILLKYKADHNTSEH